jgi:hypothetical protein
MSANGITVSEAETPGASVMAWVLREQLPANRVSASAISNAFDAVREALLDLDVDHAFAEKALKRLRHHDKVVSEELRIHQEYCESERLQREKWESVCKQLRLEFQWLAGRLTSWGSASDSSRMPCVLKSF